MRPSWPGHGAVFHGCQITSSFQNFRRRPLAYSTTKVHCLEPSAIVQLRWRARSNRLPVNLDVRPMKITNLNLGTLLFSTTMAANIFLGGCAEVQTAETKSLLSRAKFRVLTPHTEKQKEIYASLPPNKVEKAVVRNMTFYVYKDAQEGVAYIGGETEYRTYQQLCSQRHTDPDFFQAVEMDPEYAHRWYGAWRPEIIWR